LRNYDTLCKRICQSNESIVGVWAFNKDKQIASVIKRGFVQPSGQEQQKMFVQAHIMASMANSNSQAYGELHFVMVRFQNFDAFLFPIKPLEMISIGCIRPYSVEDVASIARKAIYEENQQQI
jgi:hypothetical protein